MLEKLIARPTSVIVATVAVSALGAFSLLKLPLSLLPQIERPSLTIVAKAAASARDEIVHDVTAPIERRLASVPGITSIESETRDGEARIRLGSAWQTDADRLRIDVARRIEGASAIALDDLTVETTADTSPLIEVAVAGGSGALRTRIAQRVLLPELARIEGAGKVEMTGATPLRMTVRPRSSDLAARGLTAADVEQRLRAVGRSFAAGRVREGAAVRPLVVAEPVRSIDELRQIEVKNVPLGEIADVALQEVPDDTAFFFSTDARRSPQPATLLRVYRAPSANAVALARAVRARVAELSGRVRDVELRVVSDRSGEVTRALSELAIAALLGILLGTLVLRWMIGHWRPTLALAVVIPAALLASFTVFFAMGIPLDVISLAGLALATGLLVDNSIVVLESIESAGDVVAGTRQIVVAVIASSITLMIVFAPLLYLRGLARAMFGEQAVAVVASVGASLLLSLTLTPVLSRGEERRHGRRTPDAGRSRYLALLDRVIAEPRRALVIGAILTAASIALVALLPRELFARGATRHVAVELRLSPDLDPAAVRETMKRWFVGPGTMIRADNEKPVQLDVEGADVDDVRQKLRGADVTVRPRPSAFIEAAGGDASRVELVVSAASDAEAGKLAERVSSEMQRRGFRAVDDTARRARLAYVLRWDQRLLDRASVERDVRAALGDFDAGEANVAFAEPEIRLLPSQPAIVTSAPVRAGERIVPLSAVATVNLGQRSAIAYRDDGRPARRLTFEVAESRSRGVADVPSRLRDLATSRPGHERIRLAGHARELRDAFSQMRLAFVLAAILLYLTVAAFYESLMLPLLVIAALPFAAGGALAALLVTGQSLNVMSLIGLIFLGGVVVNHTVVLLDRVEQLRKSGSDEDDAIRRAAHDRYRPVIMTTITAILAMLPLAIAGGAGVELRRSIAVVVIGGLTTATIGTLVLIPLLHRAVEPFRRRS